MVRLCSVFTVLCMHALSALGQHDATDSLLKVLSITRSDIARVNILNQISFDYYDDNVIEGFSYASQAHELATKINYLPGIRYSLILKGYYYYEIGEYNTALSYYHDAARVATPDDELLGYNYIMIGNVFRSQARYDSAKTYYDRGIELLKAVNATDRLAYGYKSLGRLYVMQWKNKEAEESLLNALHIYERQNSIFGKADVWLSLAGIFKNFSDYGKAITHIDNGCRVADELNDEYLKLQCLINRGELLYSMGEYSQALQMQLKTLDLLKTKELPHTMSRVYIGLGDIYERMGQNDIALEYFFEALKISERLHFKHEISYIFSSIAWIYKNQRNFTLAHEYIDKSLKLREEINDDYGLSNTYNVLGIIYLDEKKHNLSVAFLEKSLAIRRKIGYLDGISVCLYNLGLVFEEQKQYRKALQYQLEALQIDKQSGNKFSLGISYNSMGTLHTQINQFDSAKYYLTLAQQLGNQTRSLNLLMNNAYYWSEYYEMRGDLKEALRWHKEYAQLNDSIYFENSAKKLAEMQALYQAEQKDQEIRLLNQEKLIQSDQLKIQKSQINLQNIIIVSVILGFLLVSLLALKTYQYNRRIKRAHREIIEQKEEIEAQSEDLKEASDTITQINKQLEAKIEERTAALRQAYKELDTFFYRSSHDFRRPLTTFLGLSEVAQITVKDPNALELFAKVKDTAKNLDKMLVKLQSISDMGGQELVYKEVFLKEIFDDVCDGFRQEIDHKGIKASSQIVLENSFHSYPALIKIIIENLVENAIFFSGKNNPYIKLRAFNEAQNVVLEMEDNGEGIERQYHERIFEMYYRGSERSKGNGLGLYIVKKAVEKLNGKICFESVYQNGTRFQMVFPEKS